MPLDTTLDCGQKMDEALAQAGPAVLIDHILSRYHAVHREQFPAAIALARRVYKENDQRAALKREINRVTGSALVEEKSHAG